MPTTSGVDHPVGLGTIRGFLFGLSAIAILGLLPLIVRDLLQGGAFVYGVLLGCFGMGAVCGALLNAWLRAKFHNELITKAAFLGFAISCITLALSHHYVASGATLLLAGACWVMVLSLFNVTIQLSTPRWVVGRALALYQTGVFGGMAGGSWAWGAFAENFGVDHAMIAAAVLLIAGALAGLLVPLPDFTDFDLSPLNAFTEPYLRLDLKQPLTGSIASLRRRPGPEPGRTSSGCPRVRVEARPRQPSPGNVARVLQHPLETGQARSTE